MDNPIHRKQGSKIPTTKMVNYDGLSEESLSPGNSTFSVSNLPTKQLKEHGKPKSTPDSPHFPKMPSRKYCCSNTSEAEAKIWALCDTICASLVFIVVVYFLYTLKSDKQFLYDVVQSEPDKQKDLQNFLQYSDFKQDIYVVVAIMRELCSIFLGVLLYIAAKHRCQQQIRLWLGSTFIAIVVDLILFIPKMTFTQNKFFYACFMIAYFLYKWYEVWIVTLLFKEVRNEASVQPDDNAAENSSSDIQNGISKQDDLLVYPFEPRNEFNGSEISSIKLRDDDGGSHVVPTNYSRIGGYYGSNMGSFVLTEPPKKVQYRGHVATIPESKSIFGNDDVEIFRY